MSDSVRNPNKSMKKLAEAERNDPSLAAKMDVFRTVTALVGNANNDKSYGSDRPSQQYGDRKAAP